jgi:DNA-binding response OmpR family regulator
MIGSASQSTTLLGRVLVIDDDFETVDLLTAILSDCGYDVFSALNGGDGLMLADVERPDVMLLDLHMPGVPGFDVLRRVRMVRPDLPVVIVSGQTDVNLARATLDSGAVDYIAKPFDPETLIRAVAAALTNGPPPGRALSA